MNTPAIPPPAPRAADPGNTTAAGAEYRAVQELQPISDPPAARVERARWEGIVKAFALLIGAVADWLGIFAVWHLIVIGKCSAEIGIAVIVGLASGTIVAKAKGMLGGSTTAALLMTAPGMKVVASVLGAGSRHVAVMLALGTLLTGCAGATQQVQTAREYANRAGAALDDLGAKAAAVCAYPAIADTRECSELGRAYDVLVSVYDTSQGVITTAGAVTQ